MIEAKKKELRDIYQTSLLTKQELARELGDVSISTVDRMRKEGLIRSRKVLGQVRFTIEDVAEYLIGGVS